MTIVVRCCISRSSACLHQPLALRVERAGRFVEQQDRRILQHRARDGDALPLAARQAHASLAEERVVALAAARAMNRRRRRRARRPRFRRRVAPGRP